MSTILIFPSDPVSGQEFVATNSVTYIWTGNRWNISIPLHNGIASYTIEGGNPSNNHNEDFDNTIDGGEI